METETNSTTGTEQASNAVETASEASASAAELVTKHRKQRKDKGQLRGPRSQKSEDQASDVSPIDPRIAKLNIELVKKAIASLTSAADAFVTRTVFNKAIRLGCEKEVAGNFAASAALSTNEIEIVSECTSVIVARSEFLTKYAPEAMLLCVVGAYSLRVVTTFHRLDALETKLKKEALEAKKV
jgi:hypothetical protein